MGAELSDRSGRFAVAYLDELTWKTWQVRIRQLVRSFVADVPGGAARLPASSSVTPTAKDESLPLGSEHSRHVHRKASELTSIGAVSWK